MLTAWCWAVARKINPVAKKNGKKWRHWRGCVEYFSHRSKHKHTHTHKPTHTPTHRRFGRWGVFLLFLLGFFFGVVRRTRLRTRLEAARFSARLKLFGRPGSVVPSALHTHTHTHTHPHTHTLRPRNPGRSQSHTHTHLWVRALEQVKKKRRKKGTSFSFFLFFLNKWRGRRTGGYRWQKKIPHSVRVKEKQKGSTQWKSDDVAKFHFSGTFSKAVAEEIPHSLHVKVEEKQNGSAQCHQVQF